MKLAFVTARMLTHIASDRAAAEALIKIVWVHHHVPMSLSFQIWLSTNASYLHERRQSILPNMLESQNI